MADIVSPPAANSDSHKNSSNDGADADDDSDHPPPKPSPPKKNTPKKKPGMKGVWIQEPVANPAPRETIDMTNLVLDPSLASVALVTPRRAKPSGAARGKKLMCLR